MSIVRTYSVFCDAWDAPESPCLMWVAETTGGATAARRFAKRAGWVRKDGKDLCPDHSPPRPCP